MNVAVFRLRNWYFSRFLAGGWIILAELRGATWGCFLLQGVTVQVTVPLRAEEYKSIKYK